MKKIFVLSSLLIIGLVAPLQFSLAQSHPADGLYVGIDGSYDRLKDNVIATGDNIYSVNAPAVGIFAGFRQSEGQFTVAAEARYGYSFASKDMTVAPFDGFDLTHEGGVALLPGFWINDQLLVYGRIGFIYGTLVDTIADIQFSKGDSAVEFGGGVEIFASETVSLRLEFTRTTYEGVTAFTLNNVLYDDWKINRNRFRAAITTAF